MLIFFHLIITCHFLHNCPFPPPAGIPPTPDTPTGVSNTPGTVLLTLSTLESGTTPPQMFLFVVNVTLTFDGSTFSHILEANDYMDGEARQFTIDGLMVGGIYLFSAQAQNEFGSSDFSGGSLIQIDTSTSQSVCVVSMHFLMIIPFPPFQWVPLLPPQPPPGL